MTCLAYWARLGLGGLGALALTLFRLQGVQSGLEGLQQAHRDAAVIQVPETHVIQADPDTVEALRAVGYIQ